MRKRLLSLLLFGGLLCTALPSTAWAGYENFIPTESYQEGQFSDVSKMDWFAENVRMAYQLGLIQGKSNGRFDPAAQLTLAEAVKLAAVLNSIYCTNDVDFPQQKPWYRPYVDYALENKIISEEYPDYSAPATRAQFALLFASALPEEAYSVTNEVEDNSIPDVEPDSPYASAVYKLYRAGILTGSDPQGSFHPTSGIRRNEVAAIVTRMADPSLRRSITLHAADPDAKTDPATDPAAKTDPATDPDAKTDPATDSDAKTDPATDPDAKTDPATDPDAKTDPATDPDAKTDPATDPDAKTDPAADPDAKTDPATDPDAKTDPATNPDAKTDPATDPDAKTDPTTDPDTKTDPATDPAAKTDQQVFSQCSPAVFYIEVYDKENKTLATGSGVFLSESGEAVTNYHVIEGASRARVRTTDNRVYNVSGVYAYDKDRDLARIKVAGSNFVSLAPQETVTAEEAVYAIGNPTGEENTMSTGVISATSRMVNGQEYIQTTAAISRGFSGGALVNAKGELVGITSAYIDGGDNLNLAIPVKDFNKVVGETVQTFEEVIQSNRPLYYPKYPFVPDFGTFARLDPISVIEKEKSATYLYDWRTIKQADLYPLISDYRALLVQNGFHLYSEQENQYVYEDDNHRMLLLSITYSPNQVGISISL